MLVRMIDLLREAQRKKIAVGAFNVYNLETIQAVAEAAEELESAVIIQTTQKAIEYAGLDYLTETIKLAISKLKVPAVLHLDHGLTIELAEECIKKGYDSVMIDGSHLPLPENIALTQKVVELAHKQKIPVEGELGELTEGRKFTDPNDIPQFIRETGVDSLAVSIGSRHGHAKDEELKLELLEEIRKKTVRPLVLHGSTGVPDCDIKGAIQRGIAKINVDTLLREVFTKTVSEILKSQVIDPRIYLKEARKAVKETVKERMLLFGSLNV